MSHYLSAVYVHHHVEVVENPLNGSRNPGDIPGPHLVCLNGFMGTRFPLYSLYVPTAMVLLSFFLQYPVKGGFRCNVYSLVSQRRYYLTGWQTAVFLAVGYFQYLFPFLFTQFIGRFWPFSFKPAVCLYRSSLFPSLVGSYVYFQDVTAFPLPGSCGVCFVDQLYSLLAIRDADQS